LKPSGKRKYKHSAEWIAKHDAGTTSVAQDAGSTPALARGSSAATGRFKVQPDKMPREEYQAKAIEHVTKTGKSYRPKMKPNPKAFPDAVFHDHTLERDLKQAVKLKEDGEFETDEEASDSK